MKRCPFSGLPSPSVIRGLLLCTVLAACNMQLRVDGLNAPEPTGTVEEDCFYSHASYARPELAVELEAAMEAAGFDGVKAKATALGEDYCGKFGWASTHYEVALRVDSLEDREGLGNLFKRSLAVLSTFTSSPSDSISVIFNVGEEGISGGEDIIIRLANGDLVEARQQAESKSGEELFDVLMWITGKEAPP